MEYIAFADYHVPRIVDGKKWMTVRYGWDEERIPEAGERVELVDGERECFAKATVTIVTSLTIRQFVHGDFDGHKKYKSPIHMCEAMEQFYPDAELTPDTEVTLISFQLDQKLLDLKKIV